jgi:hypothetical protein
MLVNSYTTNFTHWNSQNFILSPTAAPDGFFIYSTIINIGSGSSGGTIIVSEPTNVGLTNFSFSYETVSGIVITGYDIYIYN